MEERLFAEQEQVKKFSNAIYYHVPYRICCFLQTVVTCPDEAAEVRSMTRLYKDLMQLNSDMRKVKKRLSVKKRQKLDKCRQALETVQPEWRKLFLEKFKEVIFYED